MDNRGKSLGIKTYAVGIASSGTIATFKIPRNTLSFLFTVHRGGAELRWKYDSPDGLEDDDGDWYHVHQRVEGGRTNVWNERERDVYVSLETGNASRISVEIFVAL